MLELLDEINQKYTYCPITGEFRWAVPTRSFKGGKQVGDLAGSVYNNGRLCLYLNGVAYLAHRVAWVIMTGEEPPELIDHKDRDPLNNRWDNLRPATNRQNQGNRTPTKGRILPMGVRRAGSRYSARMTQKGKSIHLGTYSTVEEARQVYLAAKEEYFGAAFS